jgi:primary-amine oxidase
LPQYLVRSRSLTDVNVMVWYTLNHHHVVRPEEQPVAPVAIGFRLLPCRSFSQ